MEYCVLSASSQESKPLWYALSVRSNCERAASAALSGKGYEEFLPLYRSRREWSDRSKELELPLFPSYIFCRFDARDRLLPILTIPSVISIIGAGRTPLPIPDEEIHAIQAVVRSGLHAQPWPYLATGSRILIEKGPLAGLEGITLDVNKKFRLLVSVPLLQRSVAVEIERHWVRPLPAANDNAPFGRLAGTATASGGSSR